MNRTKAIILEDDITAGQTLCRKLKDHYSDRIALEAICRTTAEAQKAINKYNPELLFVDIELNEETPPTNGIDFLVRLEKKDFEVIFVTAFGEKTDYLKRGFELNAIDFVDKPVQDESLSKAVSRALERVNLKNPLETLDNRLNGIFQTIKHPKKFPIRIHSGFYMEDPYKILFAFSHDPNCSLFPTGNFFETSTTQIPTLTLNYGLKEFSRRINEVSPFCRIHDRFIINVEHIKEFILPDQLAESKKEQFFNINFKDKNLPKEHIYGSGGYVELDQGRRPGYILPVSRNKKSELFAMLGI